MNAQPESVTAKPADSMDTKQPVTPCPRCRKPLLPGEPIYYLHPKDSHRATEPCCPACFTRQATPMIAAYGGSLDATKKAILARYGKVPNHQEFACVECQRPVWKRPRKANPRVFCTPDCSARFYNRKALRLRSKLKSLLTTCNACGGAIPGNRRGDVRYCSPACRQKAYRQRRQQGAAQ